MNASEAAHAYRLGLMGPKTRAEYEDAVRMGVVNDNYAAARAASAAHPASGVLSGAMATLNRAIPFSSEAGAGLEAGLQTLGDIATGKKADPAGRYQALRAAQQGDVDQTRADHPIVSNLATGTGYAAQLAAALASGGASAEPEAAATAARLPMKQVFGRAVFKGAQNAATGAAAAAVNGAAQPGDLSQRIQAAAASIPAGAVFGAGVPLLAGGAKALATQAVPFVAKRAGAVASEVADAAGRAISGKTPYDQSAPIPADAVARGKLAALDYLKQLGATPESLRQAVLDSGGKPITTAEALGSSGITQATGIARRAGTTPALADAALIARKDSRAQRVIADITDATGLDPSAARGHIEALVEHGQKMADPLFDAVRAIKGPIMSPELAAWAETPVGKKVIASTVQSIRNVPGANPLEHGLPIDPDTGAVGSATPGLSEMQLQPTAHAWDAIRRRMSQMVERDQFGKPIPDSQSPGNYDLNQSRRYLTTALAGDGTEANPGVLAGYRDALDMSGDYQSIDKAFRNAKGKLFGKAANADPADFAKWHVGLTPIEQEAAKASAANDILTGLDNGTLRPGTFALPHVQKKLTTLFGPEATAKLTDAMDTEARMSAAEARMRPNLNSVTGDVIGSGQDQSDASAQAALNATGHLIMGKPQRAVGSLAKGLAPYISAAQKPLDMASRNALGDLLYADPAVVAHLLEAHGAASAPPVGQVSIPMLKQPLSRILAMQAGADQNQPQ